MNPSSITLPNARRAGIAGEVVPVIDRLPEPFTLDQVCAAVAADTGEEAPFFAVLAAMQKLRAENLIRNTNPPGSRKVAQYVRAERWSAAPAGASEREKAWQELKARNFEVQRSTLNVERSTSNGPEED